MELIEKLKILMNKNNIKNISQLSKLTSIPYTTLKSIFDGDVNDIRLSTSRKLCNFFKITLDELLDDDMPLNNSLNLNLSDDINISDLDENDIEEIKALIEFKKNKKQKDK